MLEKIQKTRLMHIVIAVLFIMSATTGINTIESSSISSNSDKSELIYNEFDFVLDCKTQGCEIPESIDIGDSWIENGF
ncbi:MAG: hypothetical protein HeimC3_24110 [Candidatus Heimdallarchaeota archaeon LC_3]|nr:MAG: hypothetical protein HeimC3_24110 [Candidatus Heimdallarchaeota archaeon LC_3]